MVAWQNGLKTALSRSTCPPLPRPPAHRCLSGIPAWQAGRMLGFLPGWSGKGLNMFDFVCIFVSLIEYTNHLL